MLGRMRAGGLESWEGGEDGEDGREGGWEGGRQAGKDGGCSARDSPLRVGGSFSPPSLARRCLAAWRGDHGRAGEAAASTRAAAAAAASGRGAVPPAPPASPGLRLTRAWKRSRSPRPPPAPRPAPARAAAARIAARGGSQCAGAAARRLARPRGPPRLRGARGSTGRGGVAPSAGPGSSERAGRVRVGEAPGGRWGEGMVVEGAGAVSMTTAFPRGRGPGAELRGGWSTGTETQCERGPGGEKGRRLNSRNKG